MPLPTYNFRWFKDGNDSEIPAELLADALRSAQRAFHYAGMIIEKSDGSLSGKLRARVPSDIAKKYVLRCKPAVQGSYDVPTTLGFDELVADPALFDVAGLFNDAVDAGEAVADGVPDRLLPRLPRGAVGKSFLLAVSGIVPPRGSGWSLEINDDQRVSHVLTEDAHRRLEDLARDLDQGAVTERGTVTGELRAIDFARKQITILHPVGDRELSCSYIGSDEIELIDQRLSLVHVTGRLIMDASGRVSAIDEVDRIEPFDLSPIEVGRVNCSASTIRPTSPLVLMTQEDPDAFHQWMVVEYEPLGLVVTAPTRSALVDAVREEIAFLWDEYVISDDAPLSAGATRLRGRLQDHFEVVDGAS